MIFFLSYEIQCFGQVDVDDYLLAEAAKTYDVIDAINSSEPVFSVRVRSKTDLKLIFQNRDKFESIRVICFWPNTIRSIPKELATIGHIESIQFGSIRGINAHDLFSELTNFAHLKVLRIEGLKKIPDNVELLQNLEVLDLSFGKFRSVEGIGTFKRLKVLSLMNCRLRDFPRSVLGIDSLKVLVLSGNRIEKISKKDFVEQRFSFIEDLYLDENPIQKLDEEFLNWFPNLKFIGLFNSSQRVQVEQDEMKQRVREFKKTLIVM